MTVPSLNVTGGQVIVINGNASLPGPIIITYTGTPTSAPITVTGSVTIGGTLYIILPSATDGAIVPVLGGNGTISGGFSGVDVTVGAPDKCKRVTGTTVPTQGGGLGVLLSIENTCQKKEGGLSTGTDNTVLCFVARVVVCLCVLVCVWCASTEHVLQAPLLASPWAAVLLLLCSSSVSSCCAARSAYSPAHSSPPMTT